MLLISRCLVVHVEPARCWRCRGSADKPDLNAKGEISIDELRELRCANLSSGSVANVFASGAGAMDLESALKAELLLTQSHYLKVLHCLRLPNNR